MEWVKRMLIVFIIAGFLHWMFIGKEEAKKPNPDSDTYENINEQIELRSENQKVQRATDPTELLQMFL